jgi:hypothetical protein
MSGFDVDAKRCNCFIGNSGVAVMLYDPRRSNISKIQRESGVKFEHITAPKAEDIAKAVGVEAAETIIQVSDRYTYYGGVDEYLT